MWDTCDKSLILYLFVAIIIVINKISCASITHKTTNRNTVSHYNKFLPFAVSKMIWTQYNAGVKCNVDTYV